MHDKLTLVGDIHGNYDAYREITSKHDWTVQVGDFGMGFAHPDAAIEAQRQEILHQAFVNTTGKHHFIRGNHDNPHACKEHGRWIEDGHFDEDHGIMYIGGAWSIDRAVRTEGINWWAEEELSWDQLYALIDKYERVKPEIVISHDCPEQVVGTMVGKVGGHPYVCRTQQALGSMFHIHQPKRWFFGHWHVPLKMQMNRTKFRCLAIGVTTTIDVKRNDQ